MNVLPIRGSLLLERSGRIRDRARRGRGSRSGSGGDRLGRRFRSRRLGEVPNHGGEWVDEAAGEASLAQPEAVRLLQSAAAETIEAGPLGHRTRGRTGTEFRTGG